MLNRLKTFVALAVLIVVWAGAAAAAERTRVAVLPFFIHSGADISFLERAVPSMLASRLETTGEITVVERPAVQELLKRFGWEKLDEEKAAVIGKRLRADYVVTGSLTNIGKAYSLDTLIISTDSLQATRRAYITTDDDRAIPSKMDELANRLNFIMLDKVMVADVQVRGNRFIEQDAILFAVETKAGKVFSPQVLQEDLKRIYQMGYFKDIQITSEDTERGKVIAFVVKEKPMVRSIQIKGNKKVKLEDLQKVMEVKPRTIMDVAKVKGDVARMRKVYVDKGYYKVSITHTITPIDDDYAAVEFRIKEGKPVKVAGVTFSGNDSIPAKELRKVMETRKKHWLLSMFTSMGIFKDEALEKDVDRITAYYYSKGFLQATVGKPDVEFKDAGVYVHFTVEEGDRFTISSLDFKGDLIYETAVLKAKLQSTPGTIFNGQVLNDDLIAIKAMYSVKGFAFADVSPLTEIQAEEKKVKVVFDIKKGDKIYIEQIRISGNTRTRDNVIRREMRLYEGDIYNSEEIKRSKQEINNLGFFEEVNINTEPGSSADKVKLSVEVKERPTGAFSIGAGYSSIDSIVGMFQISQNNLFGKGQNLTLMAQLGGHSNYYNISFTEPWFRDTRQSVGFDLFNIEREYEDFDRTSSGINLRTSFPYKDWDYTRMHLTYRWESIDIDVIDDEDDVALDISKQQGTNTVSSIQVALVKDSRDDHWKPREGVHHSISMELAGLGGDSRFVTLIGSAAKYFPMPKDTAIMIRGTIGQIFPYSGKGIPISEKFFLGGLSSLRGMEVRSVGPRERRPRGPKKYWFGEKEYELQRNGHRDKTDVVGGKKELFFNFEYWFPIMKGAGVRGMVFYDVGNAYASGEQFFSDLRHCVGVGVNWYSPFGPLKLVWGVNLSPRDDEDRSNFEFSMGKVF